MNTAGTIITETRNALQAFSAWDEGSISGICPFLRSVMSPYFRIGNISRKSTMATVATKALRPAYPLQTSPIFSGLYVRENRNVTIRSISGTSPASRMNSPFSRTVSFSSKERNLPNRPMSNESLRAMSVSFSEQSFYQLFVEMHCVEQGLDVDLAFFVPGVEINLYASSRGHLAVEGVRILLVAVVEGEFVRNLRDGRVQQDVLAVEDDYRVDFVTAFLNCALEGMSSPFVGSSMKRYLQLHARANDM